ncbi:MAG: hypothetical protein JF593_00700, partial [Novosphingobium sp.]|nr:hypothetical protein [Novosphingobium sp.]
MKRAKVHRMRGRASKTATILGGLLLLSAGSVSATAVAQPRDYSRDVIAPVAEPGAIPLYGDRTPGKKSTEIWFKWFEGHVVSVRNVTYPTLTPVLP